MKKIGFLWNLCIATFSIGALLAVWPFLYSFLDFTVQPLPKYTQYSTAMCDQLPTQIQAAAHEARCNGNIIPVKNVDGPQPLLESLMYDVNLAISTYDGWRLTLDESTRKAMVDVIDANLTKWQHLFSSEQIQNLLETQAETITNTRYFATALWRFIPNADSITPNNAQLEVRVHKYPHGTTLFTTSVYFTHPSAEVVILNRHIEQTKKAVHAKRLSEILLRISIACVAISLILCVVSVFISLKRIFYKYSRRKRLLREIANREELIENGHFVAALELADRFLEEFFENVDITAFRERLMDYTNNDPKKAQIAFVETKKLKLRMERYRWDSNAVLIHPDERKELKQKIADLPELEATYSQVCLIEQKRNEELDFSGTLRDIEETIRVGWLTMASQDLGALKNANPELVQIPGLESILRERMKNGNNLFSSLNEDLAKGNTEDAMLKLSNLLAEWLDMEKAVELKKKIDLVFEESRFVLCAIDSNNRIEVNLQEANNDFHMKDVTFSSRAGVPLATDGKSFTILVPGVTLEIEGMKYKVELVQ